MESKELQLSSFKTRWWSTDTVAVVTGANRGIGFEFVRCLAKLGFTVVLTCRDALRGQQAVESLRAQGLHVEFNCLNIADPTSIEIFVSWLRQSLGGLDVLVNNAAVSFNEINENSVEHVETVMKTNFYGPKLLTEALLPLFRRSASKSRILNVSSRLGLLNKVSNLALRELLQDDERLSEKTIEHMISQFMEHVKLGTWQEKGWPKLWTDYSVSKLALNAYSRLLARRFEGHGLSVNCYCPGFTRTGMTRGKGNHTAETAAEAGMHIVLLPPDELPTGMFFIATKPSYSKL